MDFILGYWRYGISRYPFLFKLSVLLFSLDLFMLYNNTYNDWTLLATGLYSVFFVAILIGYVISHIKDRRI